MGCKNAVWLYVPTAVLHTLEQVAATPAVAAGLRVAACLGWAACLRLGRCCAGMGWAACAGLLAAGAQASAGAVSCTKHESRQHMTFDETHSDANHACRGIAHVLTTSSRKAVVSQQLHVFWAPYLPWPV